MTPNASAQVSSTLLSALGGSGVFARMIVDGSSGNRPQLLSALGGFHVSAIRGGVGEGGARQAELEGSGRCTADVWLILQRGVDGFATAIRGVMGRAEVAFVAEEDAGRGRKPGAPQNEHLKTEAYTRK